MGFVVGGCKDGTTTCNDGMSGGSVDGPSSSKSGAGSCNVTICGCNVNNGDRNANTCGDNN